VTYCQLLNGRNSKLLAQLGESIKDIQHRYGFSFCEPEIRWKTDKTTDWVLFGVHEVPASWGAIRASKMLDMELARGAITHSTTLDEIINALSIPLRRHFRDLLDVFETSKLLAAASVEHQDLVEKVLRRFSIADIQSLLSDLIREGVSIGNMRAILEVIAQACKLDIVNLREYVRIELTQQMCSSHTNERALLAIELAPSLEEHLLQSLLNTDHTFETLLQPLFAAIPDNRSAVILTHPELRRVVRIRLSQAGYDSPVLSYDELAENTVVDTVARITIE